MADEPTIEEVAAAKARLHELRTKFHARVYDEDRAAIRTLLASHASLEERVKGFEEAARPFARVEFKEENGWDGPDLIELTADDGKLLDRVTVADLRALAAFVNEKETEDA